MKGDVGSGRVKSKTHPKMLYEVYRFIRMSSFSLIVTVMVFAVCIIKHCRYQKT